MATVLIPAPLRRYTNNTSRCSIEAENIYAVIDELARQFPALKKHIVNPQGEIPSFINIFVDATDIRHLGNLDTQVKDTDLISIVPAVAGG